MNSSRAKAKFQIGQFKSLKQIFCKFEGQFDLKVKVIFNSPKPLDDQYNSSSLKVKSHG